MNYEERDPYRMSEPDPTGTSGLSRLRPLRCSISMRSTINLKSNLMLLSVFLALGLAACDRKVAPKVNVPAAIPTPQASVQPSGLGSDPTVPDAATVFAAQDAADRAKTLQEAAARNKPVSATTMTKAEESKAMPLPGQANDHSSPSREGKDDKKRGN